MARFYIPVVILSFILSGTGWLNAQPYVIPVVFHILHNGGTENISDAQVLSAVTVLNNDYNKRNADTSDVIAAFKNNIANMGIEFRLANKDPQGNCTNGIEHIYTSITNTGGDYTKIHDWPRDKYFNIWVTKKLGNGIAGFSYQPWAADAYPELDGVMMLNSYIGNIGTSNPYSARSLTGETGRFLALLWSFAYQTPSGCYDDSVADTPLTDRSFGNLTCFDLGLSVCDSGVPQNVQNFMNFSNCGRMFTNGQKDRVQKYLNSNLAQRNNLWSPQNLTATGTNNTTPTTCAPICDFSVSKRFICLGATITFRDNSYNGPVTSRSWSFPTATVTTSTDSVVTVQFTYAGWQPVTLTVMNSNGNATKTQSLVYVADLTTEFTAPYYNGFEDAAEVAKYWAAVNTDGDTPVFQRTVLAARTGSASMLLNNFNSTTDGSLDEFISPLFDCSQLVTDSAVLSFSYSCATRLYGDPVDSMVVLIDTNCTSSVNWPVLYKKGSYDLINAGATGTTTYYLPTRDDQWRTVKIPLAPTFWKDAVRFKIQFLGAHNSNNFFVDDFNIGSPDVKVGIGELAELSLSVYPNPANNQLYISYSNFHPQWLTLYDINGNKISTRKATPTLNVATLDPGIYFIELKGDDGMARKRFVKIN